MTTSTDAPLFTRGPVAALFSSYVASVALSACHELGILEALHERGAYSMLAEDLGEGDLDPDVVRTLLTSLAWAGIVDVDEESGLARPGARFDDAYHARGYFYWLVRGCGTLFTDAPHVAVEAHRSGEFYNRNMRAVAVGSRLIGDGQVEPLFDGILADLDDLRAVADLGCGSGGRLLRIARNHPEVRGIGVDIAEGSVTLANEVVAEAGLTDRITVYQADVHAMPDIPAFADVDVVTCVFMGHDFWPFDTCVRALRGLRSAFPKARRLLLCDVVRDPAVPDDGTPIFRLGFELVHALMDVYVPTRAEWFEAFQAAGWDCLAAHDTEHPPGGILFELAPKPPAPPEGRLDEESMAGRGA